MNLTSESLDYLHGRRFSSGQAFDLGPAGRAPRRADCLVDLATGRRVLHVGCCDHLPLIRAKLDAGLYLHQRLCAVASHCVGSDTNLDGVQLLRELGFAQTYVPEDVPAQEFDLCLLADVIEHVGDPVSFLRSMRRYAFKELVVVTPNAFRLRNFWGGSELINTDHRFWFSPYTLCKVLVDAGFEPRQVLICHGDSTSWRGRLAARFLNAVPRWRDTLVVRAVAA